MSFRRLSKDSQLLEFGSCLASAGVLSLVDSRFTAATGIPFAFQDPHVSVTITKSNVVAYGLGDKAGDQRIRLSILEQVYAEAEPVSEERGLPTHSKR